MNTKKSIHERELFPIIIANVSYYVTYPVLKEWCMHDVANEFERSMYEQVKCIFDNPDYGTK